MFFGPGSQFQEVRLQLVIVLWVDRSEGFRADQARRFAHDVEFDGGIGAGSQLHSLLPPGASPADAEQQPRQRHTSRSD